MVMCMSQQNVKSEKECILVEYTCYYVLIYFPFGPAFTTNSPLTVGGMVSQLQGRWRFTETSLGKCVL